MRRKTALVGLSYLAGMFFASFFSFKLLVIVGIILSVALTFMLIFLGEKRLPLIICMFSMTVGMFLYGINCYSSQKLVSECNNKTLSFNGKITDFQYTSGDTMQVTAKGEISGKTTKVIAYVPYSDCNYYDRISFNATYKKIENNVLFNAKDYYSSNGIYLNAYNPSEIEITDGGFSVVGKIREFSDKLTAEILAVLDSKQGSILVAMLCGKREYMDDYTKNALFRVGIGHIFSVSGTHLVIISFVFALAFDRLRLSKKSKIFLLEIVIVVFALFAGLRTSVVRSAIMMTLFNLSRALRRYPDPLTSLAISGIILTLFSPYIMKNSSFLLSMGGAFAISDVYPKVTKAVAYKGKFKRIVDAFLATLTIWVVTLPISLMFFKEVSIFSAFFNSVFLPLCTLSLVITVVAVLPFVFGFTIKPLLSLAEIIILFVTKSAKLISVIPFSTIPLGYVSVRVVILLGFVVTVAVLLAKRNPKLTIKTAVISVCAVIVAFTTQTAVNTKKVDVYVINYKNSYLVVLNKNSKAVIIDKDGKISDGAVMLCDYFGVNEISYVITQKNTERARGYYKSKTDFRKFDTSNVLKLSDVHSIDFYDTEIVLNQEHCEITFGDSHIKLDYNNENSNENGNIDKYTITKEKIKKGGLSYAFG